MPKLFLFLLSLLAFLLDTHAASAQELLGREGDWKSYSITQSGKKICYLASSPTKSSGTFKRRGDAYFLVTMKSKDQNEVSASSGYPYKNNADVHLTFDRKTKFRLFTQDNLSWARDGKTDAAIVKAMVKSYKMTVRGTSRLNTFSEDTYSLKGFGDALGKMESSCP